MKSILITGATGLVGNALVNKCLKDNIKVHYLTTSKQKIKNEANYKGFYWNPGTGEIDLAAFKNIDVIINLAGAPISERWTRSYKEIIVDSRIQPIDLLRKTIEAHNIKIEHFISASAVGYYPDSLTNFYDESFNSESDSFIVKVVKQWEGAADKVAELGVHVAKVRIGLVLSEKGGALPKMAKPIRFGLGSRLGSGNQWQPWIHIEDLVDIFFFIIKYRLSGVYNGVAPNAITNSTFTEVIAETLNRPLWLPNIPSAILKLFLGEMSTIVLTGQRVSSKKIENLGFEFQYHSLVSALENLLIEQKSKV